MKINLDSCSRIINKIPGLDRVVLGFGTIVYSILTLVTITKSSIWFDEAFSAFIVRFDYFKIVQYTASDVHPPVYYWILKLWITFFGTSEIAFRSLSVVFGVSAIIFGYLLVKRLFGRKAAWLSLLLMVISPMLIRYGQEARMYTLAATIALAATYVLTFAVKSKNKRPWIIYGILVSLGMWTHYFTALVWLSHWVWRSIVTWQSGARGKKFRLAFFTKNWIIAHVVAVGLFLPWLPFMATQLSVIQGGGFWIGPISANSFTNYFTNVLFYLEHDQATRLYATAFVAIITILTALSVKLYSQLGKQDRQSYLLIISLAFVPAVLLFIASTFPLQSSFVERYLIPSAAGFALFSGVTLALGAKKLRKVWRILAILLVVVSMAFGISNVYWMGNYNKNSSTKVMTRELVKEIQAKSFDKEPIISADPWVFYEAAFYETDSNPMYMIDAQIDYNRYGSLYMLRDSTQYHIKDLSVFNETHSKVWYIGFSADKPLSAPDSHWKEIQNFAIYDPIDNKPNYRATEFQITNAE
jgi:uncharacterized membrane protein